MKIIKNPKQMSNLSLSLKKQGQKIGFVPTMGYLHQGHLSLIRRARKETDIVVVSIFVNPAQFGQGEDYKQYPRDLKKDKQLAQRAGADIIFAPGAADMYSQGYQTYVEVQDLTKGLCGASRPGHFCGVTTVVTKLFNIVQPDTAYFGQKDAQQALVIKRMVKDLNLGLKVKVLPILREKDGLALSSRNRYLSKKERQQAVHLYLSLREARVMINRGERSAAKIKNKINHLISVGIDKAGIDYIALVDTQDLTPLKVLKGRVLIALAVYVGHTRLIDNIIVRIKK
ncbi:MAG: pantoate--beta-alanine ligase [Candidatus Omnitrophica bacterium]|nr:pantoate--beta-alanine ligase [Candidatus Omnitrophota bacterium]